MGRSLSLKPAWSQSKFQGSQGDYAEKPCLEKIKPKQTIYCYLKFDLNWMCALFYPEIHITVPPEAGVNSLVHLAFVPAIPVNGEGSSQDT